MRQEVDHHQHGTEMNHHTFYNPYINIQTPLYISTAQQSLQNTWHDFVHDPSCNQYIKNNIDHKGKGTLEARNHSCATKQSFPIPLPDKSKPQTNGQEHGNVVHPFTYRVLITTVFYCLMTETRNLSERLNNSAVAGSISV